MSVDPADLAKLSVEEKLDLISDLWDRIEAPSSALPHRLSPNRSRRRWRAVDPKV